MNESQKIQSARSIVEMVERAEKALSKAKMDLLGANEFVKVDPSGEPEKIAALIESLNEVMVIASDESYRWNTYLENRE